MKKHIPNALTLTALCCGITAILIAIEGSYIFSVCMIFLAIIFDILDGWAARKLKATSDMGAELDSLCDIVNFGAAPVIILYVWGLPMLAVLSTFVYVSCAVWRLAKFNIRYRSGIKNSFIGIPSPLGALMVLLPILLISNPTNIISLWILLCAVLMVAPIKISKPFQS